MTDLDFQSVIQSASQQIAAISDSPQLDAEILLSHCIAKPRSHIRAWPEKKLTEAELNQFQTLLKKRRQGKPIAYLTGSREFWSRDFLVSDQVLIPRPDTELLIELALTRLKQNQSAKILDLGCGAGIIAITLALELKTLKVLASDISDAALSIAQQNAERLGANNIELLKSNWFSEIRPQAFDMIISNPPYIAETDPHLINGDVAHEPRLALIAAQNGLQDINAIAEQAINFLKPNGHLLIEHGYEQQSAVQSILLKNQYQHIETHQDLAGNPRATTAIWNP